MTGNRDSFASIGMQVAGDGHLWCSTYADSTPILSIGAGSTTVAVSIRGRIADDDAVKFAQELARQAARFAAEVERLHAEQAASAEARPAEQAA